MYSIQQFTQLNHLLLQIIELQIKKMEDLLAALPHLNASPQDLQDLLESNPKNKTEISTISHIRHLLEQNLSPVCNYCQTALLDKICTYSKNQLCCQVCFQSNTNNISQEDLIFVEQQRTMINLGAKIPGFSSWTFGDKLQFQSLVWRESEQSIDSLKLVYLGKQMKNEKSSIEILQYLSQEINKEYFNKKQGTQNINQVSLKSGFQEVVKDQDFISYQQCTLLDIFIKEKDSFADFLLSRISPKQTQMYQTFSQLKAKENAGNISILLEILRVDQQNYFKNKKKSIQTNDILEQNTNTREEFHKNTESEQDLQLTMKIFEQEINKQFEEYCNKKNKSDNNCSKISKKIKKQRKSARASRNDN